MRGCGWPTSSALETLAAATTAGTRRMSPSAPSRAPLLSDARFCRVLHGSSYLLGACSPKHRGARCSSSSSVDLWHPRRFRGPTRRIDQRSIKCIDVICFTPATGLSNAQLTSCEANEIVQFQILQHPITSRSARVVRWKCPPPLTPNLPNFSVSSPRVALAHTPRFLLASLEGEGDDILACARRRRSV